MEEEEKKKKKRGDEELTRVGGIGGHWEKGDAGVGEEERHLHELVPPLSGWMDC